MTVDALNTLLSGAIWRAEQLDDLKLEAAAPAWGEVSKLEEELAKLIPIQESEGRIARRGAVRAALKAKTPVRAQELAKSYLKEGASKALRADLLDLLKADEKSFLEEFPSAAKHHKPCDVQMLANDLLTRGPFLLAAA